jgi:hypothetical protein
VHLITEEKLILTADRNGGLQNMEVHGMLKLKVSEDRVARVKVCTINNDTKGIQIQVPLLPCVHVLGSKLFCKVGGPKCPCQLNYIAMQCEYESRGPQSQSGGLK